MNNKSKHKRILPLLLFTVMVISLLLCSSTKGLSSYQIKAHALINDVSPLKGHFSLSKRILTSDTLIPYSTREILNKKNFFGDKSKRDRIDFENVYYCINSDIDSLKVIGDTRPTYWNKVLVKRKFYKNEKNNSHNGKIEYSYPFFIKDTNLVVVFNITSTETGVGTNTTGGIQWSFYEYRFNHWVKLGDIPVLIWG